MMHGRSRRWVWLTAAFLALLVVTLLVAASFRALDRPPLAFDAQAWAEADGGAGPLGSRGPLRDNRRARMVGDLLAHHIRQGMTVKQAGAILGTDGWGGGGAGEERYYYPLLAFPGVDQKLVALCRWGSTTPVLELHYSGSPLRLVGARVRGY